MTTAVLELLDWLAREPRTLARRSRLGQPLPAGDAVGGRPEVGPRPGEARPGDRSSAVVLTGAGRR